MRSLANTSFLRYLRRVDILAVLERRDFRFLAAAYVICKTGDAIYQSKRNCQNPLACCLLFCYN